MLLATRLAAPIVSQQIP